MYSTTIFLQSLLVKYKDDPVRVQIILDFIQSKIDSKDMERGSMKYNFCNIFRKK